MLKLRWCDIALPGDARVAQFGPEVGGVNARDSKTSPLQFVPLRDRDVLCLLRAYASARKRHGPLDPIGQVFYRSSSQYLD